MTKYIYVSGVDDYKNKNEVIKNKSYFINKEDLKTLSRLIASFTKYTR